MAEFSKYGSYSIGRLLLHNNRTPDDGVQHSNEAIDNERTVFNYHYKKGTPKDIQKRLSELFVMKKENTTVLGEMIVTMPNDVRKEDEREFFRAVYDFYCNDFGEENIMNAVVHKDETQPHIHIDFIPVLKGEPNYTSIQGINAINEWKNEHNGELPLERLCCKDLITKKYLSEMHIRLSEAVKERLGYAVSILNGATANGNRTVLQLKADTLKENIERMENQKKYLRSEINSMLTLAEKHGITENDIGVYPLLQKIDDLENQNSVLKSIITRQGYTWKKEELSKMRDKKYVSAKSTPVNFYDGSLVNASIEENAVVVIELPNAVPRNSPQKKLIDGDPDLERQAKFAASLTKQVACRESRTSKRIFLFIKTDNEQQTMENLLLMEKQLKEIDLKNRRVYMDKMETDSYDLACAILQKNKIESLYFTNREIIAKAKSSEQGLSQEL